MQRLLIRLTSTGLMLLGALAATAALADEVIVDNYLNIPEAKTEVITPRPSFDEIWIPGSWERTPDEWVWSKGRWETPVGKDAHWQKGHWGWIEGKWHWNKAHWVVDTTDWIVDEIMAPPALLDESRPEKPSENDHWVAGHWDWDMNWYWVPGYYTYKADPDATWVKGKWVQLGEDGGYWWMGGHWQVK